MDWLTEGTTYDVVQEWKKRYPQYSIMEFDDYSKITTPDMKLVLSVEKTISDVLDSIEEKKKTKKMGDDDSPSESKKKTTNLVVSKKTRESTWEPTCGDRERPRELWDLMMGRDPGENQNKGGDDEDGNFQEESGQGTYPILDREGMESQW